MRYVERNRVQLGTCGLRLSPIRPDRQHQSMSQGLYQSCARIEERTFIRPARLRRPHHILDLRERDDLNRRRTALGHRARDQDASLADLSITSRARGPNSSLDGTGWAATPLTVLVLDKDGVNVGITLVRKPLTWNILPDVVVRRWRDPRALFYEYLSGSMW